MKAKIFNSQRIVQPVKRYLQHFDYSLCIKFVTVFASFDSGHIFIYNS